MNIVQGYRLQFHTTFTNSQTRDVSLKRKYSDIKRRNIKTSVKRGHSPCQFYQRSFLQPPLSCTQEGWRPAPSDRFKRPKSIRHQRTFSDREHFMPQTNSESKRFYDKAGPQGRLPYSRRSRAFSTLPTIHIAGPSVSISSPTVRIVHSPKGVYQTSKTCHNIPSDKQNIRLLIYLDDILIVGSDIKTLKGQTGQVLDLLQSLGFIINFEKSVLTPFPVMEFLGLLVGSRTMMFYLPSHKVTKTIELYKSLLQNRTASLRELAQLLGFLESTRPAVWLAPLHFRHLQYCLIQQLALNKGSYDGLVSLQLPAKSELQWWISNIHRVNGSLIHPPSCEMTITSDASKLGWGAACGLQTTKGSWSSQERSFYINILELKAAFLAIQAFLKHKTNISIKLRLDNTTAVYYINNKGGTRSPELMALIMELWTWCLSRNIYIQAEHLPGVQNCLADKASRTCIDSTDWKIQPKLIKQFLVDRDTDLFATRLTHQLPRYVSWHPDPKAIAADAFSLNWATLRGYAFPPFNLIPQTLIKVLKDKTTIVLVAPVWQGQTWWPLLLQLAISQPVRLPSTPETLKNPIDPTMTHPMFPRLHLAVWLVSSDRARQSAFRNTLPDFSQPLFANPLTRPTIHHGENGIAGVIDGKLFQFQRV